jgi:hypothetical protein
MVLGFAPEAHNQLIWLVAGVDLNHRPLGYEVLPVESAEVEIFRANPCAVSRRLRLGAVDASGVRHQARNRLTVACNHNFLTLFDAVEQSPKSIPGLECSDLLHNYIQA